jgi:rhodanese-related sulfurtransferase
MKLGGAARWRPIRPSKQAACHIEGGLDAWKKAGGPLAR